MARCALFLHASDREVDRAALFDELVEEASLAEEMGFEACMIAEHHQSPNGHYPSPLMLAAGIAARTKRIRVGSSVLLAPLYHPVHLAEESAMVDVISSGRLILGLGIGYSTRDFEPFGIPLTERAARLEDCVQFLQQAWTADEVDFDGKHFRCQGLSIHPKPVQKPHPPIWIGGNVDAALRRAGRMGDGWIGMPFLGLEEARVKAARYRAEAARNGRPPTVALRRDAWVAADRQAALREFKPGVESFRRFMAELDSSDPWFTRLREERTEEEIASDRLILGSPEDCFRTARKYVEEAGVDWFVLRFRLPSGPPHKAVMRAIETFGREVVPRINALSRPNPTAASEPAPFPTDSRSA